MVRRLCPGPDGKLDMDWGALPIIVLMVTPLALFLGWWHAYWGWWR